MTKPLVSIVIPGWNSGPWLKNCLPTINTQTYKNIEIIIVDNDSKDQTTDLAKKYKARIYDYFPKVPKGFFDAPYRRNYGATKAKGKYIFYIDADMELERNVVQESVELCESGKANAVIVREDSFGVGIWAAAKNLERQCYWGDDTVESPRFVEARVWRKLGGLDELLGGGGDDWDFYQKLRDEGYIIARTKSMIKHNEGDLSLKKLMKKRFMYGQDSLKYIAKRPGAASLSYFPIRKSYIQNWRLFVSRPRDTVAFIVMRIAEYSAAAVGIIRSLILKK
jgi:glycosyltransferase involved in cell wall biosynthesis